MSQPKLQIVIYHYVRNLPATRFPAIKGMLLSDFEKQVDQLRGRYEMATLQSTIDFLLGKYKPTRDLCLLTFDDGLKEHFAEVTPILARNGIQGIFHVITGSLEDKRVAPVHMNHFLTAALGFERYRKMFLEALELSNPAEFQRRIADPVVAQRTYPWDTLEAAQFKYFFNFMMDVECRDRLVTELFVENLGKESDFAEELYLSWSEARQMQEQGMVIGGHTHNHRPLSAMGSAELKNDLSSCRLLLEKRLQNQPLWPFCYPYGKRESFNSEAVGLLRSLGFHCSFTTETGPNEPGAADLFAVSRVDCKCADIG